MHTIAMNTRHESDERLSAAISAFAIPGVMVSGVPYGNGHINDTYAVSVDQAGTPVRYIVQRINTEVFRRPEQLMENVRRVCGHQAAVEHDAEDAARRSMHLVPTRQGGDAYVHDDGSWWRCYAFVERCVTREQVHRVEEAYQAALAFGRFAGCLATLPDPPLNDHMPRFHDTPWRMEQLEAAIAADPKGRVGECGPEIAFARQRHSLAASVHTAVEEGRIPKRVSHYDTKINNVLLDARTGEGLCVIDLDTVTSGTPLFDVGDLLRTSVGTAPEDEPDTSRIDVRLDRVGAVFEGYRDSLGEKLTAAEVDLLPVTGTLLTFETGIRFLADYINGDVYFRIHHPAHNLQRARAQFALVAAFERHADAINALRDDVFGGER